MEMFIINLNRQIQDMYVVHVKVEYIENNEVITHLSFIKYLI